jgi:hypothetical protein
MGFFEDSTYDGRSVLLLVFSLSVCGEHCVEDITYEGRSVFLLFFSLFILGLKNGLRIP